MEATVFLSTINDSTVLSVTSRALPAGKVACVLLRLVMWRGGTVELGWKGLLGMLDQCLCDCRLPLVTLHASVFAKFMMTVATSRLLPHVSW